VNDPRNAKSLSAERQVQDRVATAHVRAARSIQKTKSEFTSLKRKRWAFENTYLSMPFACASGLSQATSPASFAFSRPIDLAL